MSDENRELRGAIVRLFHQSPTFCAGRLKPVDSRYEVSFAGKVYVSVGEVVTLRGNYVDDPKWGRQFKASDRAAEGSMDANGLAAWLAVNGDARGIGPVKAQQIAAEFGEDFPRVLDEDPEQIAIFANLELDDVLVLASAWKRNESLNHVATQLAVFGLTRHQIETLYEKFKGSLIPLLKEDPYMLVGQVDGLGFVRVDEIAAKIGVPPTHPGRIRAAILHSLRQAENDGSTCVERSALLGAAVGVLSAALVDVADLTAAKLDELHEAGTSVKHVEANGRVLYALPQTWRHEEGIAQFLATADEPNPHWPEESVGPRGLEWLVQTHAPHLDESQQRAVASSLRNRVSLISGGAGSGKTTLIKAIAQMYHKDGMDVALCAPTGKAARRLEEVVGMPASTIHRLLEYAPHLGGFQRGRNRPLMEDVVIVDEVSMVDSALAWGLFESIGRETAVVLVGDHHQLPPVGPGALLRDCIARELLPATVLNQCHRQAGTLKQNCTNLLLGNVAKTEQADEPPASWYVDSRLVNHGDVLACVEKLATGVLDGFGYDLVRDVQFLTMRHSGPVGTITLNTLLQRLHQEELGVMVEPLAPGARPRLYVGDKVIQTKNDYGLNVMNGHQGVVLQTSPLLMIDFDGVGVKPIPGDCRGNIELAYCMTPWKAQGSEWPCVVTVCHRSHSFQLHRNLLYTACTRARQTCILLGDGQGVKMAAATVRNNKRQTLLGVLAGVRDATAH